MRSIQLILTFFALPDGSLNKEKLKETLDRFYTASQSENKQVLGSKKKKTSI